MSQLELLTTAEFLRASHITRWGIVQTAKQQSIAEHMYRVWLLVRDWGPIALDPDEQVCAERMALMHDLPEIRTGDAPTPHKTPEVKAYLSKVEAEILPELAELELKLTDRTRDLVKFCDTAESVLFLAVNGLGAHAAEVKELLKQQMINRLMEASFASDVRLSLMHAFNHTLQQT